MTRVDSVRLVKSPASLLQLPCQRCGAEGCAWDRLAGMPLCFECQEELIVGASTPLKVKADHNLCTLCRHRNVIAYLTLPLYEPECLEMDLCVRHLTALLGRRLTGRAYRKLRARLNRLGYAVEQFFLLHEAFYDEEGLALQPITVDLGLGEHE